MNKHEVVVTEESSGREVKRITAEEAPVPVRAHWRVDPWLVRARTGDLYATFYSTNGHLFRSADKGETWTDLGEMQFDPPRVDVLVPQGVSLSEISRLTALADGTLLITYNIGEVGGSPLRWLHSDLYVARSDDRGQTWTPSTKLDLPAPYTLSAGESAGKMVELPDGTLLMPANASTGEPHSVPALFIHRSSDGGRTWPEKHFVCFFGCETSLVRLASGRLIAAVRYQRDALPSDGPENGELVHENYYKHVFLADSEDDGRTWKNWRQGTSLRGDRPGEVIQLSDGRVVLIHGSSSIRARISHDEGNTWEPLIYRVSRESGYPASVVLEDDTILTLCGNTVESGGVPVDGQWTAHAVRWRLE